VADHAVSHAEVRRRVGMPSRSRHASVQKARQGVVEGFDALVIRQVVIPCTRCPNLNHGVAHLRRFVGLTLTPFDGRQMPPYVHR
jgi:hypothetical protein